MLACRNVCTLWLVLLLHVAGNALKFNLFKRQPEQQEGDVRLSGSESLSEGRVEIYHEGKWGTVCDDGWGMAEAQVVCRQLRFPDAKSVVIGRNYGQASGPIWLDDIHCTGTENRLSTCSFAGWGVTDCSHKEDVGVICGGANASIIMSSNSTHSLDNSISLSDDLGHIFDSGRSCDFLIVLQSMTGNREADGSPEVVETTICAHKIILSQFPLFNASGEARNITVSVSQSCQPHFTSFIRYIYTRKIEVAFSSVQCIHWMASKFGVKQLMVDMGRLFIEILPEDALFHTQVSLFSYARETGDLVLQDNCIQYLAWNFQYLTRSPAWTSLSTELLKVLLARTDLVVPDEYFLLETVERWVNEKGDSISLETQVELLNLVRFPMIPAEKLYALQINSSLYGAHKNMYDENMLKAYEFNVLLFSQLVFNPKFNKEDDDYKPRIYTAEPWSTALNSSTSSPNYYHNRRHQGYDYGYQYSNTPSKSFTTPIHHSLIFKNNNVRWDANIFTSRSDCSNRGLRCESLPAARLAPQNSLSQQRNINFSNKLLVTCQGKYICQVQDFKFNMAYIAVNGSQVSAYPCPGDKYLYHFVVRSEYV